MTEIKNCVKRYNYNVVIRSDNALVFMKYILDVFKGKVSKYLSLNITWICVGGKE